MEPRSLQYVAEAAGAELPGELTDMSIGGVSTDTRRIRPGDLFVALVGERHDGHDFIDEALAKGAAAVLANRDRVKTAGASVRVLTVEETRRALGLIAARYRRDFSLPVIAVAGSNGKTTTKELAASVLSSRFPTLRSEASYNNDVGVPLTLLGLSSEHRAAVLELGTNHPGELAPLVRMARPDFGIITSLGREHLEFFKDLEGVAEEEGWLAELLPASGKLFIHGDSPGVEAIVRRSSAPVVRVGTGLSNDWIASRIRFSERGVTFLVTAPEPKFSREYRIRLLGRHQVINALLAVAVGAELGLSPEEIAEGLAVCVPPKMRLQLCRTNGIDVLDDTYNANADSMRAALETLRDFPCRGRRVAVLGDMAELGEESRAAHEEVGRQAARHGVGQLFAVGEMASIMSAAALDAGLSGVSSFTRVEAAAEAVRAFVRPGDVVLLKASRATRLERVSELLRAGNEKTEAGQPAGAN